MAVTSETELYLPIKRFLETHGYQVKGEVKDCDIVAIREDELLVVELKKGLNLSLLLQGINRQKITDQVYLAVEAPKRSWRRGREWFERIRLCQRLGLGLLLVTFKGKKSSSVEVLCHPKESIPRKSKQKRSQILQEFHKREGDFNTGGSSKRPIVTAYRQDSLKIAFLLSQNQTARVKHLREWSGIASVGAILIHNYYGWFERVERGIYQLSPRGKQALTLYHDVVRQMSFDTIHSHEL